MSKIINLAKKLKALAERGVGGEKTNAEKMLNDILQKHNISLDEIEVEETKDYFFTIEPDVRDLLRQIIAVTDKAIKQYGIFPEDLVKELSLGGNFMITCTLLQYIEIESMFELYKPLYRKEADIFFTAFLHANNLLVVDETEKEPSKEELAEWKRIIQMSGKIKSESYRKQIEA